MEKNSDKIHLTLYIFTIYSISIRIKAPQLEGWCADKGDKFQAICSSLNRTNSRPSINIEISMKNLSYGVRGEFFLIQIFFSTFNSVSGKSLPHINPTVTCHPLGCSGVSAASRNTCLGVFLMVLFSLKALGAGNAFKGWEKTIKFPTDDTHKNQ